MKRFSVLGRDRREIWPSLWIGIGGSLLWAVVFSPHTESDNPIGNLISEGRYHAGAILIAVVSWLCALNACSDPTNIPAHQFSIVLWLLVLTLAIGSRFFYLIIWSQPYS